MVFSIYMWVYDIFSLLVSNCNYNLSCQNLPGTITLTYILFLTKIEIHVEFLHCFLPASISIPLIPSLIPFGLRSSLFHVHFIFCHAKELWWPCWGWLVFYQVSHGQEGWLDQVRNKLSQCYPLLISIEDGNWREHILCTCLTPRDSHKNSTMMLLSSQWSWSWLLRRI